MPRRQRGGAVRLVVSMKDSVVVRVKVVAEGVDVAGIPELKDGMRVRNFSPAAVLDRHHQDADNRQGGQRPVETVAEDRTSSAHASP